MLNYSYSHLLNLNYLVNAWLGSTSPPFLMGSPISVGLAVFPSEVEYIDESIKDLLLPSRVAISKSVMHGYSFRINALRNLALSKASTTHVFVADVDVLPSRFLLCWYVIKSICVIHFCLFHFLFFTIPITLLSFRYLTCLSKRFHVRTGFLASSGGDV